MVDERIFGVLFLFAIIVIAYLYAYPHIRGPVANMEIDATVDPTGNISEYSLNLQFGDDISYNQFLSEVKGSDLKAYELRATSRPDLFTITNSSTDNRITIKSLAPFDPNEVTTFMHLNKTQDSWEYSDTSVSGSSFLPEKYINKLTYSLKIPSDIIDSTTLDNSTDWIYGGKTLTWTMDQNKNWFNPKGENYSPPDIYARFEVPEPAGFPWRIVAIGAIIAILIGGLGYILSKRRCSW